MSNRKIQGNVGHIRVSNSYTKQDIGIIKFDVNEMGNYQGQQISFRASTECKSSV